MLIAATHWRWLGGGGHRCVAPACTPVRRALHPLSVPRRQCMASDGTLFHAVPWRMVGVSPGMTVLD